MIDTMGTMDTNCKYVLAFDTSNEVVAIGVGRLCADGRVEIIGSEDVSAHRASNTKLLPLVDALLKRVGVPREKIACVCVGRGPGSFTGVRIAMATAKGVASALGVALVGLSTQDAIAWGAHLAGARGRLLVISDAMRKEVYPALFDLDDAGVKRLVPDSVVKAAEFAERLDDKPYGEHLLIAGDALAKYGDLFEPYGEVLPQELWTPSGKGLLAELEAMWASGVADPFDAERHDPLHALPVYTRLSDAEENERARLSQPRARDLRSGVQGAPLASDEHLSFMPFDSAYADDASGIERACMGTDAWGAGTIADDLGQRGRTWWMALRGGRLVGYAGGMLTGDDMEVLKIAVVPAERRSGIARELLGRIAYDAENLAAVELSLEVRASNKGAQAFYRAMGFAECGRRPKYYSDGEDACLMKASVRDVVSSAADHQRFDASNPCLKSEARPNTGLSHSASCGIASASSRSSCADDNAHPVREGRASGLILAIESSCDETAAAVIDATGSILSSIVSSQVDFHARFGGVVPEIASRKHVEAIVGVTRLALAEAACALGIPKLAWRDLDAVAATYAPGLVGALVVGVAFAKGAAWGANIPYIAVNHLEGHLYANKLAESSAPFEPPAVVSLVSGGNTMLVHMRAWQDYEVLGATIDDAVGEAFDKVAKALGMPYPGGPIISQLAEDGNADAIDFPRALLHSGDYRFSLSGLKTAVITYIDKQRASGAPLNLPDICASFQQAVIDVQVSKAKRALEQTGAPTFCLGGGVAANPALRRAYERMAKDMGVKLLMPPLEACGDNAAMIALVARDRYQQGKFEALDADAYAHADLDKPY